MRVFSPSPVTYLPLHTQALCMINGMNCRNQAKGAELEKGKTGEGHLVGSSFPSLCMPSEQLLPTAQMSDPGMTALTMAHRTDM